MPGETTKGYFEIVLDHNSFFPVVRIIADYPPKKMPDFNTLLMKQLPRKTRTSIVRF